VLRVEATRPDVFRLTLQCPLSTGSVHDLYVRLGTPRNDNAIAVRVISVQLTISSSAVQARVFVLSKSGARARPAGLHTAMSYLQQGIHGTVIFK
jgi:hypothetical protein